MRLKTRWFRHGGERGPEEVGEAAALAAWRVATEAVRTLAEDGPVSERSGGHLALVEELLIFAVQYADRLAWLRGLDHEPRRRLVEAMARRLDAGVREHATGDGAAGGGFLERLGSRLEAYAAIAYREEDPGFAAYNLLGASGCRAVGRERDTWLHARLAEVEGPEAVVELRRGIGGLLENLLSGASAGEGE